MSTIEQPMGSPDPEAVKSLLSGETQGVPLDIDPSIVTSLSNEIAAGQKPDRVDTPIDDTYKTSTPSLNSLTLWAMDAEDVGNVVVQDNEKALFLKAALNDTEISFPVDVEYGNLTLSVVCRTLSTWELDVLFGALNLDEGDKLFKDAAQYTTALQQYTMAMQIVSVNEKNLDPLRYDPDEWDLKQCIDDLRTKAKKHVGRWNSVRWSSVLTAMRIFIIKLKLCTDAAMNRDFWQPLGTV